MLITTKPLFTLTAFDLMSRSVVTIPQSMSLRAAVHMLSQAQISGAPVVDDNGRCVGMLSATDLVRWVDRGEQVRPEPSKAISQCVCCDWEMVDLHILPPDAVSRFMTPDVVTANPETSIGKLAHWMLDAHIHRIVITDGHKKPVGMVSTTDILAAVAREEALSCDPTAELL